MMSSMYSGVSGLKMHQKKMDVIGNNIANVNTLGYKKGQVTFKEVFSQTVKGAGGAQGGKGGTNPQQVGLGGQLGSINTIHTQGAVQRTDNPTDLMIDGDGYFIISDDASLNNKYYTRAGNFDVDYNGNLVTSDGFKVLGYDNGELSPIQINLTETVEPKASSYIEIIGNLDSRQEISTGTDPDNDEIYYTDTIIKDSLGNSYKVNMEFSKESDNNWSLNIKGVENIDSGDMVPISNDVSDIKLNFDNNGKLISADNFDIEFDDANGIIFGTPGDNKVSIDLSGINQYANENSAKGFDGGKDGSLAGYSSGVLKGFSIDNFGTITGTFTNGINKSLAQIGLAKFDNSAGLEKIGNNAYKTSANSGEAQIATASSNGLGSINAGALEMSNVDLSLEFTEMITTQRGFQANSRIITTSDEMLQELVNLKR